MKLYYAIIGAGNGGQAIGGYIARLGHSVKIYDSFQESIDTINKFGGIKLTGIYDTFCKIELASTNIEEVLEGADVIMVVNPSMYHREIGLKCAPYLKENQMVFLHPGGTFGAFAFKKALEDGGCHLNIPIAESNTLIYACRITAPGVVNVNGKKDRILVATLPASENDRVCQILQQVYPEVESAKNVLVTSFDNTNPIFHPAPTLLSTSWVESNKEFLYYHEGISDSIGKFIIEMDKERLNVGMALGLEYGTDLIDAFKQYELEYHTIGDNISDVVKHVDAYSGITGPKTLKTRYIYEDIPMGLVAISSLGKLLDVNTDRIDLIISLSEKMLDEDFRSNSRNVENLGLSGLSKEQIMNFAVTGEKC